MFEVWLVHQFCNVLGAWLLSRRFDSVGDAWEFIDGLCQRGIRSKRLQIPAAQLRLPEFTFRVCDESGLQYDRDGQVVVEQQEHEPAEVA